MQSRYYNPAIGRFLNADIFASTGQGFLGHNMFAYCLNNPVCMADNSGTDAIYVVVYDEDQGGIFLVGHAYLYIQDSDGKWYMTQIEGEIKDKSTARVATYIEDDINMSEVKNMRKGKEIKGKDYVYIKGDFSDSVDYAKAMDGTDNGGYCVIGNNCMHYVRDVLNEGSFKSKNEAAAVKYYYGSFPSGLYDQIIKAQKLDKAVKKVKKFVRWVEGWFGND